VSLTTDIDETAPQGARIRRADGSAVECDLTRYPRGDRRGGGATWKAVARENVRLDYDGDRFECDSVPPGAVISFTVSPNVPLLPDGGWAARPAGGVVYESDFACPEGGAGMSWPTRPRESGPR
jgi:hypothetical protein